MDEIIYRAWDSHNQEMQYNIQRCHDGLGNEGHTEDWFGAYFGDGHTNPEGQKERYIVMQYMGIKDELGEKVFKDDLLEVTWEGLFEEGAAVGIVDGLVDGQVMVDFPDYGTSVFIGNFSRIKKIGNIYESGNNPYA